MGEDEGKRMNSFIERVFENTDSDGYYLVKMNDISNNMDTYEGSCFIVGFNLPRELWGKKLKDITVGQYQELERMTLDANICISDKEYQPFQLGQTIGSIEFSTRVEGKHVWSLIESVRSGEAKPNYHSVCSLLYKIQKGSEEKDAQNS